MVAQITPSKQVSDVVHNFIYRLELITIFQQAASAINSLKMESPMKKINFDIADKENQPLDETALANLADKLDTTKPEVKEVAPVAEPKRVAKEEHKPAAVAGIRAEEIDEPILQENPQRFVLFPIKYHEVRDASRRVK